jgi:hypothetical protein
LRAARPALSHDEKISFTPVVAAVGSLPRPCLPAVPKSPTSSTGAGKPLIQKKVDDEAIQAYLTRKTITNFRKLDSGIYLVLIVEA